MEIFIILRILIVVNWWVIECTKESRPQGTKIERDKNPNLSTNDWNQHLDRLDNFGESNYRRRMFYKGPKGGKVIRSLENIFVLLENKWSQADSNR